MSAANDCNCACPTPVVVEIPGTTGAPGAPGSNGTNGVNAYTTITAIINLPVAPGPVVSPAVQSFGNTAWMSVGQVIFISDGVDWAHFRVLTIPSSSTATLEWLDYADDAAAGSEIGSGATVSPSGVQPELAAPLPTALTDNSTGSASDVIAAGAGVFTLALYVNLADIANGDLITGYTPGYKFKILGLRFVVEKAATTAAKLATITPKINGVSLTGGALSLTSANCTPQGAIVNESAVVSAGNTGSNTDTISLTGSGVTAFVEGGGWIMIQLQNMDTADAIASLADHINDLITSLT